MADDSRDRARPTRVYFWERVNARFALILSVALLPLGVISLVQTRNLQAEAQSRAEEAMLGATLRAATGEIGVIRRAQGAAAALASTSDVVNATSACGMAMRRTAAQMPSASLVAFIAKSGLMTCSSNGRVFDYSGLPDFQDIVDAKAPKLIVHPAAPVSGTSVVLITHPVFSDAGDYMGYTGIALPHAGLSAQNDSFDPLSRFVQPVDFWTFDGDGTVLTSSNGMGDAAKGLPTRRMLKNVADTRAEVFNDMTADGVPRSYAVVPIVRGELMLLSSWNYGASAAQAGLALSPYFPPFIMWAIGMLVAAWAAEWLVSRHVRRLTRALARFSRGDRSLQLVDMAEAPAELREAGEAFSSMADGVMRAEAGLEDSIHQKEVLLREVHHRVKNNLQLIASIMNLQMRKAVAPETKFLLKGLHDRVMGLATIHRGLYQTSGMADVRADELLTDIVRQVINIGSGPGRKIDLKTDVEEVHLIPDQAVPLSLLLTEAVTNAMKYAGPASDNRVHITLRLRRDGGRGAVMEVENSLSRGAQEPIAETNSMAATGLGDQLLKAFAQQLGGTLETTQDADTYRLRVRFDVSSLTAAEERAAGRDHAAVEDQPNPGDHPVAR